MKSIIEFFRDHLSKTSVVCLVLIAVAAIALIALNAYVLDMTNGCYNAFELALIK